MAKNLITTNIAGSIKAPFTQAALDNLQANIPEISSAIIQGMLGSYTTNDVIVLYGFSITLTVSGTVATWTKGAVYYNGEIYQVSPGTLTKASGAVFLYSISDVRTAAAFSDGNSYPWIDVRTITITSGTSGSGIADYGATSVKALNAWHTSTSATGATYSGVGTGSISGVYIKWIKNGNICTLNYTISANLTGNTSSTFSITIPLPINAVVGDPYYNQAQASVFLSGTGNDTRSGVVQVQSPGTLVVTFFGYSQITGGFISAYGASVAAEIDGQISYQV